MVRLALQEQLCCSEDKGKAGYGSFKGGIVECAKGAKIDIAGEED